MPFPLQSMIFPYSLPENGHPVGNSVMMIGRRKANLLLHGSTKSFLWVAYLPGPAMNSRLGESLS